MTAPFKACTVRKSFGNNMTSRFVVMLNQDATDIMGETKLRYVFESEVGANKFAKTLQGNLDAAYADACGE